MSPRKVNERNSSSRKRDFLASFTQTSPAMRPCHNCAGSRRTCRVGEGSEKCVECVRRGLPCDLSISPATLKRLCNERIRLRREVREVAGDFDRLQQQQREAAEKAREAAGKLSRLQRQLESVEDREERLAATEWQNIIELEEEESGRPPSGDLPFDVALEQFQLPTGFDWASVASPSAGTFAAGSGSLPGSQ